MAEEVFIAPPADKPTVKLINGENDAGADDAKKPTKKEKTKAGKAKRNKSTNSDVEAALLGLPKKVGYFSGACIIFTVLI